MVRQGHISERAAGTDAVKGCFHQCVGIVALHKAGVLAFKGVMASAASGFKFSFELHCYVSLYKLQEQLVVLFCDGCYKSKACLAEVL